MASNGTNADKEFLINEKIEQIRKKNEEIRLRHLEVLEDKKNADALSAIEAVRPQPATSHVKSTINKPPSKEKSVSSIARTARHTERFSRSQGQDKAPSQPSNSAKIYSNFAEGEGPPPDPGYSFLADDERDAPRIEIKNKKSEKLSNKANESEKFTNLGYKSRQQRNAFSSAPKMNKEHRIKNVADENWRAERAAIDAARIQRQKTVEGNWRRAWDNEKVDDEVRHTAVSKEHKLPLKYNDHSTRSVPLQKPSFSRTVVFNNDFTTENSANGEGCSRDAKTNYTVQPRHVVTSGENIKISVSVPPPAASSMSSSNKRNTYENFKVHAVTSNDLNGEKDTDIVHNRSKLRPLSQTTKVVFCCEQNTDKVNGLIQGDILNKESKEANDDADDDLWDDCSDNEDV